MFRDRKHSLISNLSKESKVHLDVPELDVRHQDPVEIVDMKDPQVCVFLFNCLSLNVYICLHPCVYFPPSIYLFYTNVHVYYGCVCLYIHCYTSGMFYWVFRSSWSARPSRPSRLLFNTKRGHRGHWSTWATRL